MLTVTTCHVYAVHMDAYEIVNKVFGAGVTVGWALMLLAPRSKATRWFVHSDVVPLAISVAYLAVVAPWVPQLFASFDSLDKLIALMTNKPVFFIGWIHYLAFDFIIGRVLLGDAQRRGIPHWAVAPCLLLTFMLGPVGYGLYALVRVVFRKTTGAVAPLPA